MSTTGPGARPTTEYARLVAWLASVDTGDVVALPPDPQRFEQAEGHEQAREVASQRGITTPHWLFWHRQAAHAFDDGGSLVSALRINWGGDHQRVAAVLATLPPPLRAIDHGPGGVFEIVSDAAADRLVEPYPDVGDSAAARIRLDRITAVPAAQRSDQDWAWLNRVLCDGDRTLQGRVVRHLAGSERLTDEAFAVLLADWVSIYAKAPSDVLVWDLLRTLRRRGDPRHGEVLLTAARRKRWTFHAGASHDLDESGGPDDLPLLYELAGRPGRYEHTPGDGTALRAWVRIRAAAEGRTPAQVATEALDDPHFDAAARRALRRMIDRG